MMILAIVLVLCIKSLFAATLCNLDAPGSASAITACLKTIPKDPTELEKFVSTVIEYVKNSPYPLLFMGGPNGLAPFDVLGKLNTLKSQAASWTGTVLQFYEEIYKIIGELKDPHAMVVFPFLSSFGYLLPYGFAPVAENENSLKLTANRVTESFTNGGTDYTGSIIEEIDFTSGGSTYKLAAVAFSEFALEVGSAGHDPHALYNAVMKKGNIFSALELFRPEERYNSVVALKGKDKNDNSIEITIPWLGVFGGTGETFDDLNPLVSDETTPGRRRNSEKHIDRDSIKHFLPRVLHNQIPPIFVERERMIKKIKQQFEVSSNLSANDGRHESRLITSMYEKMLAARGLKASPSPSPSPSSFLSPVDASMLPAIGLEAINLEELYKYVDDGETNACIIYADAANKLGYIKYTSFMQSNGVEADLLAFMKGFGEGYRKMVNKGVTDVIFDVRGNGGGLTLLVEEFTDFFFHNTIYPADLETDILLGREGDMIPSAGANYLVAAFQELDGPPPYYKVADGAEQPLSSILVPNVTKTHENKAISPSTTFKAEYTQRGFLKMRYNTSIHDAYGGYSPFDPQHFYVITDGVCASCCGIFTKLAVETKAARVIGYGVNPTKKTDISTYYPGNCAGSLFGSDQVEQYRTALAGFSDEELQTQTGIPGAVIRAMLPPKFDREGVSFGVTDFEFFSRNPSHPGQTLYMVPAHVTDVLPLQVSSAPDTMAVLKEIASVTKNLYIDNAAYCATGEVVVVDDSCQTTERTAAHELWGKTCVDTSPRGLTGACAFSHCDTGYQLSAAGCAPIPEPNDDDDSASVVSVPALLLALIFAVLVFW